MKIPTFWEALNTPLLTLQRHKNNTLATYTIRKKHVALCACILTACVARGVYGAIRYQEVKQTLAYTSTQLAQTQATLQSLQEEKDALLKKAEQLQTENAAYNSQIADLEKKAAEIEEKINALNASKQEIYQKLDGMDGSSSGGVTVAAATPKSASTFTPYVFTPYNTVNTRTALLSAKLDGLFSAVALEESEYIHVAENVTEVLARKISVPAIWPVRGIVTSEFSYRNDPFSGGSAFHTGLDISCPMGTTVKATANGTVIKSEFNGSGYGNMVVIDHGNGYTTLYAHNSELLVSVGEQVTKGQPIASSGATGRVTGPHCHYEVMLNGQLQDPRDYIQ